MYQHRNKVYLSVSPRSLMIFFLNKEVVTVTSCFKFGNHFLWCMYTISRQIHGAICCSVWCSINILRHSRFRCTAVTLCVKIIKGNRTKETWIRWSEKAIQSLADPSVVKKSPILYIRIDNKHAYIELENMFKFRN